MGVRPEKNLLPGKLRKTISFFDFGTPVALGPENGPAGLLACLLLACLLTACLLDAHAPPWCPDDLIHRLKFYKLQLGDPYPNPNQEEDICMAALKALGQLSDVVGPELDKYAHGPCVSPRLVVRTTPTP